MSTSWPDYSGGDGSLFRKGRASPDALHRLQGKLLDLRWNCAVGRLFKLMRPTHLPVTRRAAAYNLGMAKGDPAPTDVFDGIVLADFSQPGCFRRDN
jgi:hypothetical protein